MNRDELIARLVNLPNIIESIETRVLMSGRSVRCATEHLKNTEALLLCGPPGGEPFISGKNAEQRAAELFQKTEKERADLRRCEDGLAKARVELEKAKNEFAAARSIARLLAVEAA